MRYTRNSSRVQKKVSRSQYELFPYLVGMLVAIAVFRDSGALNLLQDLLNPDPGLDSIPVGSSPDDTDSATDRQRFNRRPDGFG